jgi:ribosomal protein L36
MHLKQENDESKGPATMDNYYRTTQPSVLATAPYARVPSPPPIIVPPPALLNRQPVAIEDHNQILYHYKDDLSSRMSIFPSPNASHVTGLSRDELHLITTGETTTTSGVLADLAVQTARGDGCNEWVYEARRRAQRVLDYLYLGPAVAAKDRAFLAREGITMVLCARDPRFGELTVNGVRRAVEGSPGGVEVEVVDAIFDEPTRLLGVFAAVLERINAHILAVHRKAAAEGKRRRGKVLVVCETGNDLSATMVVAYVMAMYGLGMVRALQFVQMQRFCIALRDDVKYVLQTYGDILRAKGQVGAASSPDGAVGGKHKRGIEMTSDENDEEMGGMRDQVDEAKHESHAGRAFAPFVERDA